jgi:hypothetical protein
MTGGHYNITGGSPPSRCRAGPCSQAVITNNFASLDPDISTRGTVGTWADVCEDGSSCADSSCGTDGDGPIGQGLTLEFPIIPIRHSRAFCLTFPEIFRHMLKNMPENAVVERRFKREKRFSSGKLP